MASLSSRAPAYRRRWWGQLLRRGYTVDAITGKYLHITEEDVEACRRYHEAEMERSLADMIAKVEKATPEKVTDWRDRIVRDPRILVATQTDDQRHQNLG